MSDEQRQILDMVANGKINIDEAERLLKAIGKQEVAKHAVSSSYAHSESEGAETPRSKPKYLHIVVDEGSGAGDRVNIKIPLQVLRMGIKLQSLMPESAREKLNDKLSDKGIHLNLNSLDAKSLDSLIESLGDLSIDIEDGEDKVRIFCE
ncbi:MAG: hypothetical protein JW763_09445 [candidate division Zixibacteria bacterium]|nr:hypothetical protein [candidate division Zixibacteria bacterium]